MFKKKLPLILLGFIPYFSYGCDAYLLERNSNRVFSAIWNKNVENLKEENIIKSLSFLPSHFKDFEKLEEKKVLMYVESEKDMPLEKNFVLRKEFPLKAMVHPYYTQLEKLETVAIFFQACMKLIGESDNDKKTQWAICLLSSEVANKLFDHYYMILEMQKTSSFFQDKKDEQPCEIMVDPALPSEMAGSMSQEPQRKRKEKKLPALSRAERWKNNNKWPSYKKNLEHFNPR